MRRSGEGFTAGRLARVACAAAAALLVAQCAKFNSGIDPRYGVAASPRVVRPGEPVPKGGGVYRVGKPYKVGGRWYVPSDNRHYRAEGLASWYGDDFHGRLTANGEVYDMASISAAHPTLPLPSYVRVTNLRNGRSIIARVNDRGPYAANRLIDVSERTAKLLGFYDHGLARVRVEYVGPAPLAGSSDRMLVATLRDHGPAPTPSEVRIASAAPFVPQMSDPAPTRRARVPIPPERPYSLGEPPHLVRVAERTPPHASGRMSAATRIDQTFGRRSPMASIADPMAAPSSGVLAAPASPVASFAPAGGGAGGAAFISGRGLY